MLYDTDVYSLCCNKLIWIHVNDLAALVLLGAILLMTSHNHMGLWSGDYTNLLPQFIMQLKVCPGEGLMRFEARLQPWQTPNRSWVLHGTQWETYTDAHSGIVLCFHLFKHKQENANMMSSYITVQISVFCVMIVVFHGTGNKKLLSDHDVKIYLIALIIFRLLLWCSTRDAVIMFEPGPQNHSSVFFLQFKFIHHLKVD